MRANIQALLVLALLAAALNACNIDVNGYRSKGGDRGGTYRCVANCP